MVVRTDHSQRITESDFAAGTMLQSMMKGEPTKCIFQSRPYIQNALKNAFRWVFFHYTLKMHGPSCKIVLPQ
jgi:hypothetical protein